MELTLYSLVFTLFTGFTLWLATPIDVKSLPGPLAARFTRLWFFFRVREGDFHHDNIALHQQYGPIVRYAPGHYSFAGPEAIKAIYGTGNAMDKSAWYLAWSRHGITSLFTEISDKAHGGIRRKFQATYSMSSTVSYEAYVDSCIGVLSKRFEGFAQAGKTVDLAHWMMCYAADAISTVTYSKRMGFLDCGEDVGDLFKNLHGNLVHASLMGIYAWLHSSAFRTQEWLKRLGITKGTPRMFLATYTEERVSEKRKERELAKKPLELQGDPAAPRDFLSKFLDSREANPATFSEWDIRIGLTANIIAGSDTTASALTAALYCLLKNPLCLMKLREEIASCFASGHLSSPPTFKQAQSMPYLQAVIQESMRLHAAVGLPLQRVVPSGGKQICGHFFPAGSVVGVNAWVFHYNESIFGPDVDKFRPERWIEADAEKLAEMNRYWMPFGLGSRTCIGKNISLLEMSKLLPVLVERFEIDMVGKDELQWVNHWFVLPTKLLVRVRVRQE